MAAGTRAGAPRPSRRRVAVLLLCALASVVVLVFVMTGTATSRRPSRHPPHDPLDSLALVEARTAADPGAPPKPSPGPGQTAGKPAGDPPPVIDSISVEKPSVCNGEENLVTVRAHTTNRTDANLHYVIDGQPGQSVPVTLWRSDDGPGKHVISVFGRGNVMTTVPMPEYEVRDCVLPRVAVVTKGVRANTWAEYDFHVSIATPRTWNRSKAGSWKPFEPASYLWSFGDGESVATTAPTAQHSYEGRAQDTYYSYFLVSVEVHGKDGDVVEGRTSLALVNPAFEALQAKGVVALFISLQPRFPEVGPDGRA